MHEQIMPHLLADILTHQFDASLGMLNLAIARCPESNWNQPVAAWKYCQAAFHAVLFADLYLQPTDDIHALKRQPFHAQHQAAFADYEELQDRPQILLYDKPFVLAYLQNIRGKAQQVIAAESPQVLAGPSGFAWRKCSRGELHVYNIRHIQHHAAQLILRLRLDTDVDVPWLGHAWPEPRG